VSRILLVDDEPQLVHALRRALEEADHEVLAAPDGETGIAMATTGQPDLIVLDLKLPDLDGIDVVRRLRSWYDAPILILSAVTDETRKVQALDAGADDFLHKPFGVRELTARLRALLRRRGPGPEERTLYFPDLVVDLAARRVNVAGRDQRLTPTEWRILEALVSRPGRLLTHKWLLRQVWDDSHGDEARQSLRSHVRSLRAKLGDDAAAPRFVRTESGAGYRWLPPPDSEPDPHPGEPVPDGPRGGSGVRDFDEIMHDLNNVLTAMRFAAYLMGKHEVDATEPATAAARATDVRSRWEGLVVRASTLAVELEHAR
jgi:two-component system KDP operon response regulator KdpE